MIVIVYYPGNGAYKMLAIDNSLREFFNQLTKIQWEWILATIIFAGKLIRLRLENRSYKPKTNDDALLAARKVTTKASPEARQARHAQGVTRNSEPCI